MSDRSLTLGLRSMALLGVVLTVAPLVIIAQVEAFSIWFWDGDAFLVTFSVFFAVIAYLVAPRQPRNPVVWTMAAGAFFAGMSESGFIWGVFLFNVDVDLLVPLVPANLPTGFALGALAVGWMWVPAMVPSLTFGFLLFPDGRLPSPRWRPAALLAGVGVLALSAAGFWSYRPWSTTPADEGLAFDIAFLIVSAAVVIAVFAMVARFRSSGGEVRQQIKWVLWGAALFVIVWAGAGIWVTVGRATGEEIIALMVAETLLLTSYGIAIGRHRLFDVDLVISRTFVFGLLAVFITAMYVGIVVGIGYLLGAHDEPNPVLGILATVIIAISFQPLRRRLQQVANRIVYGRRATPYEVLSTFSQGVAAVDPDVLTRIARSLGEGTTANGVTVWLERSSGRQPIASWPTDAREDSAADHSAPIIHDGEQLGLITLSLAPGQPFTPVDARLLDRVAGGLGLALRNLKLTEDLKTRVEELRESRRRIVAVQDMTRRRLERDLHDGAQQRLVALKIKLGIGSSVATKAGLVDLERALERRRAEADAVIDSVRDFARGIYPPLLEAEGLKTAIIERSRRTPIPTTVQAPGVGRYPREVEATIYFCVVEALQNAAKHSAATSIHITLEDLEGKVGFEVRDDGTGFDPAVAGMGLTMIADRLDAQHGSFALETRPGRGTVVSGRLPIPELVEP